MLLRVVGAARCMLHCTRPCEVGAHLQKLRRRWHWRVRDQRQLLRREALVTERPPEPKPAQHLRRVSANPKVGRFAAWLNGRGLTGLQVRRLRMLLRALRALSRVVMALVMGLQEVVWARPAARG